MPKSVPQNAAIFLRPLARLLERQGHSPEDIFQRHGIDPACLSDQEYRVPSSNTHDLLNEADALLGQPALGIDMARYSEYSAFGGLGIALAAGGSVRAVLNRITRFHGLMSDVITSRLQDEPDELAIFFFRRGAHEPHPQAIIFIMASIVRMLRFRIDGQLNPLRVTVPPLNEEARHVLERFFRCQVAFGEEAGLAFPADRSASRLDASDAEMAAMLEGSLSERLAAQEETPLNVRLTLWLEGRLPEGEPSLDEAATVFNMSPRSLQRKLSDAGSGYQKVIDETRRALVERHLPLPGMTITQLTFLLGFSDVSSFSRAFRKWYGVAPSRYRSDSADS